MTRPRVWTCQRKQGGVACRQQNPSRKRKCEACGAPKPARRRVAHLAALERSYEEYVVLNGGERCGVCGRPPAEGGRRLDRDHDHGTGMPRGLLCHRCNRSLATWMTPNWLRAAIAYLERGGT